MLFAAGMCTDDYTRLYRATQQRKRQAFRPGTIRNHKAQFVTYLAFCQYYGLKDINPSQATICMYAEFLARSFASPRSIRNYIAGVRLLHKYI